MSSDPTLKPFPTQSETIVVKREKGKLSRFWLENAAGEVVATLEWTGFLQMGAATGSWSQGQISFKQKHWLAADLQYQLSGKTISGQLPFEWKRFANAIDWENERFRLKAKGWFLRHFQLFDAQDELLAEFRIREKFISFRLEISLEKRLYKYKNPEALVLTGLYVLFVRLRRARSAG